MSHTNQNLSVNRRVRTGWEATEDGKATKTAQNIFQFFAFASPLLILFSKV